MSFKKSFSFFSRHSDIRVFIKEWLAMLIYPFDHLRKNILINPKFGLLSRVQYTTHKYILG